jgi:hypothetical protein
MGEERGLLHPDVIAEEARTLVLAHRKLQKAVNTAIEQAVREKKEHPHD